MRFVLIFLLFALSGVSAHAGECHRPKDYPPPKAEVHRRILDGIPGGRGLPLPPIEVIDHCRFFEAYGGGNPWKVATYLPDGRIVLSERYDDGGGGEVYIGHEDQHYVDDLLGRITGDRFAVESWRESECRAYSTGILIAVNRNWVNRVREQERARRRYDCDSP